MGTTVLLGIAKRVALIAREQLGIPQRPDGLEVNDGNDEVIVEIIPSSKLRKQPLIAVVKDGEISIENILWNIEELDSHELLLNLLSDLKNESLMIDTLSNGKLSIKIRYKKNISLTVLDKVIKRIFSRIKELWLRIIFESRGYSIRHLGMYGIDFFGEKYVVVRAKFDELTERPYDYWLPNKIISFLGTNGAFINGNVGIDYIHLPIFSSIVSEGTSIDFIIHYFKDSIEIGSIRLSDIHALYKAAIEILRKLYKDETKISDLIKIRHLSELVSDLKIWKEIMIRLKEFLLETSRVNSKRIARIRPGFINNSEIVTTKETRLNENDRKMILQLLPKLEKIMEILEVVHNENKLFTEIIMGRILMRLVQTFPDLEIYYGNQVKKDTKTIKRTKNSASLNINLKRFGLKDIPDKANIKLINNGNKNFIVIEL